jgi:AP-1 complex subunit gamma-1
VVVDHHAVSRHRVTILECLRDPDISIRRRALALAFDILNEHNVESLTRELLDYLPAADDEFIPMIASKMTALAEKLASSGKWFSDTLVVLFTMARGSVREEGVATFLRYVSQGTVDLQAYTTFLLFRSLSNASKDMVGLFPVWTVSPFLSDVPT